MTCGESVIGTCVGGMEMVDLSGGNNLGQKRTCLEATKQYFKLTFLLFVSFFLGRCKLLIFQLPCLFTVVYNSLEILSPFQSFAILIQLVFLLGN